MGCTQAKQLISKPPLDLSGPATLRHFDVQRVIGEGGFGKVKAVTLKKEEPQKWYAMKVLTKETIVERGRIKEVFRERDLLTFLRHERICNLYFSFQDAKFLYLVMDIALGGDLRYQLNHNAKGQPFSEERSRIYAAQLVLALAYVHSRGVIHRDVKPENVLLNSEGWVMLTDFGISRDLDEDGFCYSGSGTSGYMAPELYLKERRHSTPSDWFALGVTIHEFLTRRRPFRGERIKSAAGLLSTNSKRNMLHGEELETAKQDALSLSKKNFEGIEVSKPCLDFLVSLFQIEPNERLGASSSEQIKEHPWFQRCESFDWTKIEDGTHAVPFVPNTKKMNAEPDADIHAVFLGDEEERKLRDLLPTEQALFDDYEYDYRFAGDVKELPHRAFPASATRQTVIKEPAAVKYSSMSSQNSCSSLVGSKPTLPVTPSARDSRRLLKKKSGSAQGIDVSDINMDSDYDEFESVPSTKYTSALITTSIATDPDFEGVDDTHTESLAAEEGEGKKNGLIKSSSALQPE